jgi:multicomponent Na+:H+ antiporter subunit D
MSSQWPILVVVIPLLSAFIVTIISFFKPKSAWFLTVLSLAGTLWAAIQTLQLVMAKGHVSYYLSGWKPPYGISYEVDSLNGLVLAVVALVGFLVAIYAKNSVEKELKGKAPHFYVLFLLSLTGLLGISITGDVFNLYVLLEIAALTGYGLIALGKGRAYMATFNYLILGTIGACFYLLGVGYLLLKTGSLNMADIAVRLPALYSSQAILIGFIFIILGIWVKMAFFPLHSWLPNAYTYAPTATSCLMAPLMTKVSVYVMLRMMYTVFSADYVFSVLQWQSVIIFFAVVAIVVGSLYALAQTNLKKMLTYLVVAEIGYMVGGAWLGNRAGLTGATYHILADAMMTLCLFMAVGCIIYKTKTQTLDGIKGAFKKMPITLACFLLGAFSMIGIPPTCGFFSKWYLLSGAFQAGQWLFFVSLLFSSLVNAILFFRIIEIGYFQ